MSYLQFKCFTWGLVIAAHRLSCHSIISIHAIQTHSRTFSLSWKNSLIQIQCREFIFSRVLWFSSCMSPGCENIAAMKTAFSKWGLMLHHTYHSTWRHHPCFVRFDGVKGKFEPSVTGALHTGKHWFCIDWSEHLDLVGLIASSAGLCSLQISLLFFYF